MRAMCATKKFNTAGLCNPLQHYMVDMNPVVDQIIADYIEPGEYFTMNRARQFGKTTTLELLHKRLADSYIVLDISFEAADEYFASLETLAKGLLLDIADCLKEQAVPKEVLDAWQAPLPDDFPLRELGKRISMLCSRCGCRGVVLIVDEVDKSSDNQIFLSFLGLLRDKYLRRNAGKEATFQSVILAGVYDIKNLKLKLHPNHESKYNSPWNIAADFTVDMSFSAEGIKGMLADYEADHHTDMDLEGMSRLLYDYTSGYPYLVSRLCKLLDEQIAGSEPFPDPCAAWTEEGFQAAVNLLLNENNTLFDDMRKKLDDYRLLSEMLSAMLFTGKSIAFNPDNQEMDIGIRFGFIKADQGQIIVANRIFETRMYNFFLSGDMVQSSTYTAALQVKNEFVKGRDLDMKRVLQKFTEHFTDIYGESPQQFVEENGRKLFLLYLKPIINGTGNYYIESRTRTMGRTDVIVDYLGKQYVIEMKIYRGNAYHERGEAQLIGYLDDYHIQTGYMISFCFNKQKNTGVREIHRDGKTLIEAVV